MSYTNHLKNPPTKQQQCALCKLVTSITDPNERQALNQIINTWTAPEALKIITQESKITTSESAIRRHRANNNGTHQQ